MVLISFSSMPSDLSSVRITSVFSVTNFWASLTSEASAETAKEKVATSGTEMTSPVPETEIEIRNW